jgi:prevent-host-death family protein
MERIGIYEAKSRLSKLVEQVEAGHEVVLTRRGRPVAKIVPAQAGAEVDNSAAVDEIIAFSKTLKGVRRFDVRKALEWGRR